MKRLIIKSKVTLILLILVSLSYLFCLIFFNLFKTYTFLFVDPFSPVLNIILLTVSIITFIFSLIELSKIRYQYIYTVIFSIFLIGLSVRSMALLKKSDKVAYRFDLGLGAIYLYIDETENYILEERSFGTVIIRVGKYHRENSSIINLDKEITYTTYEKLGPKEHRGNKIDLTNFKLVENNR